MSVVLNTRNWLESQIVVFSGFGGMCLFDETNNAWITMNSTLPEEPVIWFDHVTIQNRIIIVAGGFSHGGAKSKSIYYVDMFEKNHKWIKSHNV